MSLLVIRFVLTCEDQSIIAHRGGSRPVRPRAPVCIGAATTPSELSSLRQGSCGGSQRGHECCGKRTVAMTATKAAGDGEVALDDACSGFHKAATSQRLDLRAHHNDRTIEMSDRTFGAGLKTSEHFDFMHQLCEHIRRWLALSAGSGCGRNDCTLISLGRRGEKDAQRQSGQLPSRDRGRSWQLLHLCPGSGRRAAVMRLWTHRCGWRAPVSPYSESTPRNPRASICGSLAQSIGRFCRTALKIPSRLRWAHLWC